MVKKLAQYKCPTCVTFYEYEIHSDVGKLFYSCLDCGDILHRTFSFGGFILKGSGFYRNDK